MKKLLFGAGFIMLMLSCNGKNESANNAIETGSVKDTTTQIIAEDSTKNQTVADSISQEVADPAIQEKSLNQENATKTVKEEKDNKPSPNAKEIDKLLRTYSLCAKQHDAEIRAGNQYDSYLREIDIEAGKIDKKLRKFKGEMTKEQLAKYKKADKMLSKTPR